MITDFYRRHALANRFDNTAALMAQNGWENALRIGAGQGIGIGVANTGRNDANQDFAFFWRFNVNFYDFQRLVRRECHGGTGFDHWQTPSIQFRGNSAIPDNMSRVIRI